MAKAKAAPEAPAEKSYSAYKDKAVSPVMKAFAVWLEEVTGYKVDERTVALAGTLRMEFQKSKWWAENKGDYKGTVEKAAKPPAASRRGAARPTDAPTSKTTPAAARGRKSPAAKADTPKPTPPARRGRKGSAEPVAPY